jgi:lipoyl(octanoyl) transferase
MGGSFSPSNRRAAKKESDPRKADVAQNKEQCWVADLGLVPYGPACELQRRLVEVRKAGAIPDVLLLCEHPHVITLGRNGKRENLRASSHVLAQMNVEFRPTDRGGDVTYHGPGQIVGYPILDLAGHRRDVRWYVDRLEEVMIRTTADFGVVAKRLEDMHGVWIDTPSGEQKLGALGVHLSRWVTSHGFAYNVATDLRFFDLIVPCGNADKRATSLECALGRPIQCEEVRVRLTAHFGNVFGRALVSVSREELHEALGSRSAEGENVPAGAGSLKGSES